MGFRKFFARLGGRPKLDTERADPPVPPRPRSQLVVGSSSSELSIPPTLQRRSSDGRQSGGSIQFQSVLTV